MSDNSKIIDKEHIGDLAPAMWSRVYILDDDYFNISVLLNFLR